MSDDVTLKTGMFVKVSWPDGSAIQGLVDVSSAGVVSLRFGPEIDYRWMTLGFVDRLHPFVRRGALEVIPSQPGIW